MLKLPDSLQLWLLIGLMGCASEAPRSIAVCPESPEGRQGFTAVFNGRDFQGWVMEGDSALFSIENGCLVTHPGRHGWLRTEREYTCFELRLEYKMSRKANSGVFFRATAQDPVFEGMEIQLRDDYGRTPDVHRTGALYDVVAAAENRSRPTGEWNALALICQQAWVTVVLNGKTVLHEDLDQYTQPVGKFPGAYRDMPRRGHLGLQNHTNRVWFRDLRLRELDPTPRSLSPTTSHPLLTPYAEASNYSWLFRPYEPGRQASTSSGGG